MVGMMVRQVRRRSRRPSRPRRTRFEVRRRRWVRLRARERGLMMIMRRVVGMLLLRPGLLRRGTVARGLRGARSRREAVAGWRWARLMTLRTRT